MSESFTATTARSLSASVPLIWPSTVSSSIKLTERDVAPLTTWLFVAIRSSSSFCPTITPVPLAGTSWLVVPKNVSTSSTVVVEIATRDGIALDATSFTDISPVAFTLSEVSLLSAAVVVVVVGIVTSCFCSVAVPITFVPTAAVPMKTPPATSPKHAAMASVMPHFFAADIGFFAFFL